MTTAALMGASPGDDLTPPTEADARGALLRHYGGTEGARLWDAARSAVRIRRVGGALTPEELLLVAAALADAGGIARVVAQSLRIRCRTYQLLRTRVGRDPRVGAGAPLGAGLSPLMT